MRMILLVVLVLFSWPAAAQDSIRGKALALDGDTILVFTEAGKQVKVRLWGVDAPEMKVWPWGPLARAHLDIFLKPDNAVTCKPKDRSHNRVVGQCFLDKIGTDLGAGVIELGAAVEYRTYSHGFYAAHELKAQHSRVGVWGEWKR